MITVISEVTAREGARAEYLDPSAEMRPLLERIDGLLSVERFESLTHPGKLLSVSVFRDEAALDEGRRVAQHRAMQSRGRHRLFADYRLRVARVIRDYGPTDRAEAPQDSRVLHDAAETR